VIDPSEPQSDEAEVSDTSHLVGLVGSTKSLEPSRAMRRMSFRPGS
jgi:hypothetical protein